MKKNHKDNASKFWKEYFFLMLYAATFFSCGSNSETEKVLTTISSSVSGLEGTLVIQINDGEKFSVLKNGSSDFKTQILAGSQYQLNVFEEPCEQRCTIDKPQGKIAEDGKLEISTNCITKAWTIPSSINASIDFKSSESSFGSIGMNYYGDTVISWSQNDTEGKSQVYEKEFRDRVWKNPKNEKYFFGYDYGDASWTVNAINASGDTVIGWVQSDGRNNQFYLSEFLEDIWIYPQEKFNPISFKGTNVAFGSGPSPIIKLNDSGDVIAAWIQFDGFGNWHVYKAERISGKWSYPSGVGDHLTVGSPGDQVWDVSVSLNKSGQAVVAWRQIHGSVVQTFAAYRDKNKKWGASTLISDVVTRPTPVYNVGTAIDGNGTAYVTWYQKESSTGNNHIYLTKTSDGTWASPSQMSVGGFDAYSSVIAINELGQGILAWDGFSSETSGFQQVFESQITNNVWTAPEIVSVAGNIAILPKAAIDGVGNIILIWLEDTEGHIDQGDVTNYHLFKAEYSKASGWKKPSINESLSVGLLNSYNVELPQVVASNCRKAILWKEQSALDRYQTYYADYR